VKAIAVLMLICASRPTSDTRLPDKPQDRDRKIGSALYARTTSILEYQPSTTCSCSTRLHQRKENTPAQSRFLTGSVISVNPIYLIV